MKITCGNPSIFTSVGIQPDTQTDKSNLLLFSFVGKFFLKKVSAFYSIKKKIPYLLAGSVSGNIGLPDPMTISS